MKTLNLVKKNETFFASLIGLVWLLFAFHAAAVQPNEMLEDPALEERARVISQDLRCVVCQNETIDDSNATLAQDMRRLVRQRVLAGDSNQQVLDYMVERYGDFVLLRPKVSPLTWLLWFGPFVLLVIGGFVVARHMRKSSTIPQSALTAEEEAALAEMADNDTDTHKGRPS